MKLRLLVLATVLASAMARAAEVKVGSDYIWWEAEAADVTDLVADMSFKPNTEQEAAVLSGGRWIGRGKATKEGFAEYEIPVERDGTYILYVRKFYTHGPFRWRFDEQPWQAVTRSVALLDDYSIRQYLCVNWVEAGRVDLTKGKRRLRVESTEQDGAIVLDAFCVSLKPMLARGILKPDQRVDNVPEGWFAFEPEWDFFGDSPIDLRSLNEAVAGENGFIQARGEQFVHSGSGKPVRFWAVNAGPRVEEMTKPSIDALARFLAKRGINMVRRHGPVYIGKGPDASQIDPAKIDRLLYFVHALKQNGIYTGLSIHFPHWLDVREDRRIPGYEKAKDGRVFAVHFFDSNFQGLLKSWWKAVLTTRSPYSGKTLAEDPAVAYCEVINEDNYFFYTFKPYDVVPEHYMPALEKLFGQWLAKKYGSIDKAFEAWGPSNSNVRGDDRTAGRVGLYPAAMLTGANWAVSQRNSKRAYDCTRFLAENQRDFFNMMRGYIRRELGYGGMVCGSNMGTADHGVLTPIERWANGDCDFHDLHGYYGGRPNRSVLRFDAKDAKGTGAHPAIPFVLNSHDSKPVMCTEFAWNQPNVYQGEASVLAAVLGRTIGMDGLVFFALDSGPQWSSRVSNRQWPIQVPSVAGLWPATALIYRTDLMKPGKTVVQADLGLEKLLNLEGTPVVNPKSGDDLNEAAPASDGAAPAGRSRVDSRAFMVGKVNVTFVPDGREHHVENTAAQYINSANKILTGSNGEWTWDYGTGILEVRSAGTQGVCGFLSKKGDFDLPGMTISSPMEYASILAAPLDGKPLGESTRILLQVGSESKDNGFSGKAESGGAPIIVRKLAGTVGFKRADADRLTVTPLDHNGYRTSAAVGAGAIKLIPNVLYYIIESKNEGLATTRPAPREPFLIEQREKFSAIVSETAAVEKLAEGIKLGEGPVWIGGDDGHLIFSDAESSIIYKWNAAGGLKEFRKPSNRTNGNAIDAQGRLISCEMSAPGRRVVRTEPDGSITVLADKYNGKKLSSPNDLAVKSDGTIWFSDPTYGINARMKEQASNNLYRLDPGTGRIDAVVTDREMPNGVVLSPDEKTLYLADSWKGRWIWAYTVGADNSLSEPRQFAQIDTGIADGMKVDTQGNLYSSAPDGVHIFAPDGKRIGKIRVPGGAVNLAFGGAGRRQLFITNRGGLYRIDLLARGVAPPTEHSARPATTGPAAIRPAATRPAGSVLTPQDETWFAFPTGGKHGMPVDVSFLNKDNSGRYIPAGSHGFLTAKDGDFVFEDGTAARFWGLNCCAGAVLGSEERAVEITEQMARVGCNLVRLHHLDSWFNPIIDYGHPDGTTQHLNPKAMRLLDRFIAEAKKRGIYVNLDPWVQRYFKEADGVADYGKLGKNGNFNLHPYVYFDPRMQELIRKQWKDVWTHVNEFTGLAYKDDPCIALTEVINEGLLHNLDAVTQEHYRDAARAKYKVWAEKNNGVPMEKADLFSRNVSRNNLLFLSHLHRTFYRDSHAALREIGVRVPINMNNWGFFTWVLATQSDGDYMDRHFYYGGDQVGPGKGLGNLWLHHAPDVPNGPFCRFAAWSLAGKPVTSSECGHHVPKTYRSAYMPGLAAVACLQGWDGFMGFGFSQYEEAKETLNPFGWESNPELLVSHALGALIYRRGDVSPARRTVAFKLTEDEIFTLRAENGFRNLFWNTAGFNAAIEEHKVVVCLPGQDPAALNPIKTLDAEGTLAYKHPNTELRSDTGELWRDWTKGVGAIDTPRTQVAYGKLGESGKAWETRDCAFDIRTPFAVVGVSSLTQEPVSGSSRLLLVAVARTENTGMSFGADGIVDHGRAPVVAEPVRGVVRLRTSHPSVVVYPLQSDGTRGKAVETPVRDGAATIDLGAHKTIVFEIEASR